MKKELKQEWDGNTLCIPYISLHPSLHALCMTVGRGHGVIIGNTQSVSIPFLFQFFFHQSSLYPIKIFAKCFYLLVNYLSTAVVVGFFSALNFISEHINGLMDYT